MNKLAGELYKIHTGKQLHHSRCSGEPAGLSHEVLRLRDYETVNSYPRIDDGIVEKHATAYATALQRSVGLGELL